MSRALAVTAAAVLLILTACGESTEQAAAPAPAPAPAPEVAPAPMPAEPAPPPAAEDKPVVPAPEAMTAAPAAPAPAAKVEAPAAPAAKSGPLTQDEALALAGKGNCLACHKIDAKVVGPAWKDVGAKYKGDANGAAKIAANIKKGGSFGWKLGMMPARGGSQLSDADVDSLAKFIAGLK